MIILYYKTGHDSCWGARQWFKDHDINPIERKIEYILREDLIHALSLTENGLTDLLKCPSRSMPQMLALLSSIKIMKFEDSINFILEHPNVLRTPIIIDEKKLVVGYNSERMRIFLSRKYRTLQFL